MTQIPRGISGIINPPPELRNTIDKAATYVARNGKGFEKRLLEGGKGDEFSFIEESNPYHPYYVSKVDDFVEKMAAGIDIETTTASATTTEKTTEEAPAAADVGDNPFIKKATVDLNDIQISASDLDVLKMAAMFGARHGKSFLSNIANRERSNPVFEFLLGSSQRHTLFQSYLTAYEEIVNPHKNSLEILHEEVDNKLGALTIANDVAKWREDEKQRRKDKTTNEELERMRYQSIDWQDFVVVDTIEFPEEEIKQPLRSESSGNSNQKSELKSLSPPPPRPATVKEIVDLQKPQPTLAKQSSVVTTINDSDFDSITIREGHVRDQSSSLKRRQTFIDPATGQEIPLEQANEHMRRSTISSQHHILKKQKVQDLAVCNFIIDSLFRTERRQHQTLHRLLHTHLIQKLLTI